MQRLSAQWGVTEEGNSRGGRHAGRIWAWDFGMSITTKIQWCDSTCNPTMGCEGCELWNPKTGERSCYAGVLHLRYGGVTKGFSPTFDEVTYWPGRMTAAAKWRE